LHLRQQAGGNVVERESDDVEHDGSETTFVPSSAEGVTGVVTVMFAAGEPRAYASFILVFQKG
jgi:hypothetical protein